MDSYNDDLVMSFAIGLWVRDTALRLRAEGMELSKKTLTNFGNPSQLMYTPQKGSDNWKIKIGDQEEDLTWLL